jgi:hypothetical protein
MRLFAILLPVLSAPLFACCVFDNDLLEDELLPWTDAVAVISGRVERMPAAYYAAMLDRARANELPGGPVANALAAANALDQLNQQDEAIDTLIPVLASAPDAEEAKIRALLTQLYIHLWWRGGSGSASPDECLKRAGIQVYAHPQAAYLSKFLDWAVSIDKADPNVLLPDYFGLRLMGNKLAVSATTQLHDAGLDDTPRVLLDLIKLHPVWENFDTFHTLSLAWVADGRQPAAHFARLRAWELHAAGRKSRLPGIEAVTDIRRVTVLHLFRDPSYVEKLPVDEPYRNRMRTWFDAQRAYTKKWTTARDAYAKTAATDTEAFWAGFNAPTPDLPPMPYPDTEPGAAATTAAPPPTAEPQVSQAEPEDANATPWILIGGLLALLSLGFVTHRFVVRKEPGPTP